MNSLWSLAFLGDPGYSVSIIIGAIFIAHVWVTGRRLGMLKEEREKLAGEIVRLKSELRGRASWVGR